LVPELYGVFVLEDAELVGKVELEVMVVTTAAAVSGQPFQKLYNFGGWCCGG